MRSNQRLTIIGTHQRTLSLLLDGRQFLLVNLEIHGDGRGFDSDTTFFFVLSRIRKPHVTSLGRGDDTRF